MIHLTRYQKPARAPRDRVLGMVALSSLIAICAAPACSDANVHPSLISAGGGTQLPNGQSGASSVSGNAGDNNGLGGASDGGAAGTDNESAGASGDSGTGRPDPLPSVCKQTASWSAAVKLPVVSGAVSETLLSLTPDELDLAFLRAGVLYVAHRAQVTDEFSVGAPLSIPTGYSAADGAALSADGKRLILAGAERPGKLGELSRPTRDAAFSNLVDETAFAALNQISVYTGRVYASPVISSGDDQLIFNSAYPGSASTVVVSTREPDGSWSTPMLLTASVLNGGVGARRLPTGVSADARTLFYFNEESGAEEARWRDTSHNDSPLYDMMSLGKRRGSTPNSACNRLYSESNSDVVVETD